MVSAEWLAVVLLVVAGGLGVRAFLEWRAQQQIVAEGPVLIARLDDAVGNAQVEAVRADERAEASARRRAELVTAVRADLMAAGAGADVPSAH